MSKKYLLVAATVTALFTLPANTAFAHDSSDKSFVNTANEAIEESGEKENKPKPPTINPGYKPVQVGSSDSFLGNMFQSLFSLPGSHIGGGYSSFTVPAATTIPMSGWYLSWSPVNIGPVEFGLQSYFLSGSVGPNNFSLTPLVMEGFYHFAPAEGAGVYTGLGYATTSGSVNGVATTDTGFVYEAGLEYRLTPNFIVNAGYKNIGLTGTSMGGFSGGVSLVL